MYVPGIFAMMALFMVNSVNAQDLSEEHTETAVGAVPGALKLWLSGGMTLGIVAVIMAIWSYVDVWARHDDIKDGPVCLPVICPTNFSTIAALGTRRRRLSPMQMRALRHSAARARGSEGFEPRRFRAVSS